MVDGTLERVRIGHAERDAAVEALATHFAAGRLSADEHGQRVSAALVAQTDADLLPLFADLPEPDGGTRRRMSRLPARAGRPAGRLSPYALSLPFLAVVALTALMIADGVQVPVLPILLIAWFGLGPWRHRGRRSHWHGPPGA